MASQLGFRIEIRRRPEHAAAFSAVSLLAFQNRVPKYGPTIALESEVCMQSEAAVCQINFCGSQAMPLTAAVCNAAGARQAAAVTPCRDTLLSGGGAKLMMQIKDRIGTM